MLIRMIVIFLSALLSSALPAVTKNLYTEADKNISVNASHPYFTIRLKSNPTTGYRWSLQKFDANLLTPVNHHYEKPNNNLVGAGGHEIWKFYVKPAAWIQQQPIKLNFLYARPWQQHEETSAIVFTILPQAVKR